MFMALSGTFWIAGAGSLIVGGLYWPRGNTRSAFTSLVLGSGLGGLWMFLKIFYGDAGQCPGAFNGVLTAAKPYGESLLQLYANTCSCPGAPSATNKHDCEAAPNEAIWSPTIPAAPSRRRHCRSAAPPPFSLE